MSSGSSNSPYFDRNAQFYLKMFNANTAKVIRLFFLDIRKKKLNAKKLKGKKIKLKLNFQLTQQNLVIQSNSSFTQSNSSLTVVNSSLCNVTQPNLQCPLWEYKERFLPLRQKFSLLRSLVFFLSKVSSVANMGQTGPRDNAMLLKKSQSQGQIPGLVTHSIRILGACFLQPLSRDVSRSSYPWLAAICFIWKDNFQSCLNAVSN